MAMILGTNCGFVTVAPTTDPAGTGGQTNVENRHVGVPDTTPSGTTKITEIGWWSSGATDEEYLVGIYEDNGAGNYPGDRVFTSTAQTMGSAGWQVLTGLDITVSASTTYWIAVAVDGNVPDISTDFQTFGGIGRSDEFNAGTLVLADPWDGTNTGGSYRAFYAVTEGAAAGTTRKIKISGTFVDKPILTKVAGTFVDKTIQIKVGGTFQDA